MTMKKVRPIDANEIHFTRVLSNMGLDMELAAKCTIDSMPTLDYEPVRHGEWIPQLFSYGTHKCSRCGWRIPYSEDSTLDARNYCPNCGAKMDGKEHEQ